MWHHSFPSFFNFLNFNTVIVDKLILYLNFFASSLILPQINFNDLFNLIFEFISHYNEESRVPAVATFGMKKLIYVANVIGIFPFWKQRVEMPPSDWKSK